MVCPTRLATARLSSAYALSGARESFDFVSRANGCGKTLSGFLATLCELNETPQTGLHTLYISPLKALTHDIQRNFAQTCRRHGLDITIETRTGDTPSHKRQRQRKKAPKYTAYNARIIDVCCFPMPMQSRCLDICVW